MLGNGIFSIFGAGLNAAMSSGAANEQWGNQLKLMDIQNRYNEQMAKNNQLRNKDLWDYTNYENQKQHIKNAGFNPALMYGMGGGGGVSANGAQGQGVTQPTDRSVENAIRPLAIGRKNYLFCGNSDAAIRASMIYSLLGSCKAAGVNPSEWLEDILSYYDHVVISSYH